MDNYYDGGAYAPALAGNAETAQRRQMMAQRLMSGPAPAAPGGGGYIPMARGGGEAEAGGAHAGKGILAGLDPSEVAQAFERMNTNDRAGFFGGGQNGYKAGFLGTGIGGQNSPGADVLQLMGFYNPLPSGKTVIVSNSDVSNSGPPPLSVAPWVTGGG